MILPERFPSLTLDIPFSLKESLIALVIAKARQYYNISNFLLKKGIIGLIINQVTVIKRRSILYMICILN